MNVTSLVAALCAHAASTPAAIALSYQGADLTYAALWQRIEGATLRLSQEWGVAEGDRVAILGFNHPDQIVLLAALMRLGALLLPLNYRLAPAELRAILGHAGAALLIADAQHAQMATGLGAIVRAFDEMVPCTGAHDVRAGVTQVGAATVDARAAAGTPGAAIDTTFGCMAVAGFDGRPIDCDAPALLVYTSGTTGTPKGAVHTVAGLGWNAMASDALHGYTRDDVVLTALPLFHVGGLCIQTVPALYAGARVILHARFDPRAWLEAVARERPTLSLMVPATMRAVIEHPLWSATDLSSLRLLGAGSSTIPEALILAFHARGVPVCQIYGATETGPVSIVLAPGDAYDHVGAAGRPALGCAIRLVGDDGDVKSPDQVGEIWVRGPNVMRGYWREPDHPAYADGWFRTGDLARRDAAGFYTVVGRSKELIISGGENVYPAEIENLLADMPEVAEAAVVGLPDPRWGEVPVAVVVLRPGARLAAPELLARLEGRIARFKQPRRVVFRATLPRNAMAKVQKAALVQELQASPGSP